MVSTLAFLDLGAPELIIILAIALLLFGGRKLPELSRSLSASMREIRKGINGDGQDESKKTEEKSRSESA
ncbi:MAG TPA: twin-arginine translocase TatA/TatE family subunit [Patescibacteria group bacterium]|nr:twin-arginine translocase TatA/TatE family subunit [Patescibacteria group bacterium]